MAIFPAIPQTLDGLRVPARFVARARVDQNADGSLRVAEAPSDAAPVVENYVALVCDGGAHHYFHFMEAIIWLFTIQHAFLGGMAPARIVFTMPWDNPQNRVQRGVLGALYPGVPIGDPGSFSQVYDNALIYDRGWAGTTLNKVLEPCMGMARPYVMALSRMVRQHVGAFSGTTGGTRFLHVTRPAPRCFTAEAERDVLARLGQHGVVNSVDFAALPWEQQVRMAASHDVLLGVHGNGLTNLLWMRPGGLVLEFFPDGAHHYDYQFFAELCGVGYFGFEGVHVFPGLGRFGPPYGHGATTNRAVKAAPTAQLERILNVWKDAGAAK
jgi:hypothetical protein